ncbi:MAG: cache domain-containing protein [Deltaproteobacteria bacterium]|nr:cache domain-containing protein [Deltaproteobacteria bacterium]
MKTVYSKMVLVIFLIITMSGGGIAYLTYLDITEAISKEQEKEARNVLNLIMEIITNEYEGYTQNKLEAVNLLRENLKHYDQMIHNVFENYQRQAEEGLISETEAKRRTLNWLYSYESEINASVFIYNLNLIGIHARNADMIGRRLSEFQDLRGQDALFKAKEMLKVGNEVFLVVSWPQSEPGRPTKHLTRFSYLSKWSWILATSLPIENLEVMAEKRKLEILAKLEKTFAQVGTLRSGYLFLFDSNRNLLIHPLLKERSRIHIANELTEKGLAEELYAAASSGVPLTYESTIPLSNEIKEKKIALIDRFKAFDWYVCYTLPVEDIKTLGRTIAGRQVQLIIMIFLCLCLATVAFLKVFIKPLTILTRHTKALISHDFVPPEDLTFQLNNLAMKSKDERGELAQSFLVMQEALTTYLAELKTTNDKLIDEIDNRRRVEAELVKYQNKLEQLVENRTAALEASNHSLRLEIEERQRIQEMLQENQKVLFKAEQIARLGSWEWNLQNDKSIWSDQHFRNIGFQPGEVQAGWTNFFAHVHPEDQKIVEKMLASFSQNEGVDEVIYRTVHSQGEMRYIRSKGELIKDETGRPWKYTGTSLDITAEKLAEKELLASLREKEILLQEVHHRVKNNMQVIISLLSLQAARLTDQSLIEILRESENRIRSMALVHESLYQSTNISAISFDKYIADLVYMLIDSYYRPTISVDCQFNLQELELTIEQAVPVSLIMTELISNAFKHAFSPDQKGILSLACRTTENKWGEVRVGDNGSGLSTEVATFHSSSMGMQLVKGLATTQLKGTIQINQAGGTEFIISWPLKG